MNWIEKLNICPKVNVGHCNCTGITSMMNHYGRFNTLLPRSTRTPLMNGSVKVNGSYVMGGAMKIHSNQTLFKKQKC